MPFVSRLANTQTPQRLYALCKLVQYKKLSKKELLQYLQPQTINKSDDVFKNVFSLATQGNLVAAEPDGTIKLNLTDYEMASIDTFRRAIAKRVFSDPQLIFSRFSAWYIMRGSKVYRESTKELATGFDSEININNDMNIYNETNITGWRTWFCFLGLGFSHAVAVPNAAVRLQDVLTEDRQLERGKPLPFKDFMAWLNKQCPELDYGAISVSNRGGAEPKAQQLSLALSAGLRALHDSGKIKLNLVRDAQDVWFLAPAPTHEINSAVSEIAIGRW